MKTDNWKLKINVMELPENNIEYDESQSPKNNKLLVVGLFVVLAVIFLVPGIFFLTRLNNQPVSQNQDYQPRPQVTSQQPEQPTAVKATLGFSGTAGFNQNESKQLNLVVDTAGYLATAVELYLRFDPEYLEVESVQPADFFDQPNIMQNKIDNDTGLVSMALGTFTPKAGKGNLVTVDVKAKNLSGRTEISFTTETKMAAKGEAENILGETKTLVMEIN